MLSVAYRYLTADQLVNEGTTLLMGFILRTSTDGGDAIIYDGIETGSGRIVVHPVALANDPLVVTFHVPVKLDVGLYVDVGSNVSGITLFYIPAAGLNE